MSAAVRAGAASRAPEARERAARPDALLPADEVGRRAVAVARAAARLVAFSAATAALYAAWRAGDALLAVRSRGANDADSGLHARRAWRNRLVRAWARTVAEVVRMRVTVRGRPPAPPFFLVANHLGYMDVVALSCVVDCRYVARADVAAWPAIGRLCRAADVIFVDRSSRADASRAARAVGRALEAGDSVALFPEGTSTDGASLGPFRSPLFDHAARAGIPVHVASLRYRTPRGAAPASRAVCWWGDAGFAGHLARLLALPGFEAEIVFGPEPVRGRDRKELAARAREAVLARFTPVDTEEGLCTSAL